MAFTLAARALEAEQQLAAARAAPWYGEYLAAKGALWSTNNVEDFNRATNAIAIKYGIAGDRGNLLGQLAGKDIADSQGARAPWYKEDSGISPAQAVAIGVTLGTGAAWATGAAAGEGAAAGGGTSAGAVGASYGGAGDFAAAPSMGVPSVSASETAAAGSLTWQNAGAFISKYGASTLGALSRLAQKKTHQRPQLERRRRELHGGHSVCRSISVTTP